MAGRRVSRLSPPAPPPSRAVPSRAAPEWLASAAAQVIGSLTLAGAALAYLGWLSTRARGFALGVDVDVISYEPRRAAQEAVGWLIAPLLFFAVAALAFAWCDDVIVRRHVLDGPKGRAVIRAVRGLAGVLLLFSLAFEETMRSTAGLAPALMALAIGLWLYSARLAGLSDSPRAVSLTVMVATAFLMALLVFTAASQYAIGVGYRNADTTAANLPVVQLYMKQDMGDVPAASVTFLGKDAGHPYRYDGLRLLHYRPKGNLVLVSADWRPRSGRLVVLPDDGTWRLAFGSSS